MAETAIGALASTRRSSISPAAGSLFMICCVAVVVSFPLPWVLNFPVLKSSVSEFINNGLFEIGFVLAAYRIWRETKQRAITAPALSKRPVGVRIFAIFQIFFATITFLVIFFHNPIRAFLGVGESHAPWWDSVAGMAFAYSFAAIAAFLGYYAWAGSKAARDAIVILSATQIVNLLIWYGLWLAGVIPPPSDYAPSEDRPFSPKEEWLMYAWSIVNFWYFGISRARRFYTA